MLQLLISGAMIPANALFAASEFALARLRPTQVSALVAEIDEEPLLTGHG